MINIITSNGINVKSIANKQTDFIISHMTLVYRYGFVNPKPVYKFTIYYDRNMILDESEYQNSVEFEYELIPVDNIPEALNFISDKVLVMDGTVADDDEDREIEEVVVSVACHESWNSQAIKYLDKEFTSNKSTTQCLNMYQYLSITRIERMCEMLKAALQTEFIYAEDPISVGFAIYKVFSGGM